jgi:spore coat polysaccharide biosynthesis protein SpsF (cytidylyltransferase family)
VTRTVILIQARMSSRRLPGKVLKPLGGRPALWWLCEQARQVRPTAVLIPEEPKAPLLAAHVRSWGLPALVLGGRPVADVLGRYAEGARVLGADVVVRLTGDCPCHAADVIRRTLDEFQHPAEYLFSHWRWSLPKGQEVEVFTRALLARADREAVDPQDREHVTPWMRRHVGDRPAQYTGEPLCLDTPADLARLRARPAFARRG